MAFPVHKLVDCCELITDGDHQPPPKSESGVPFITISDIDEFNTISYDKVAYAPLSYYDSLKEDRKAKKGDVLYSVVGSYGKPVLVKQTVPIVFQRHIALLRPNDAVLPAYLFYSMLNRDFYNCADAVAIGAAQKTITLNALRNMQIPLPSFETQKRIVQILEPYDSLIENNRRQIKLLEEAAQRLYKEWFVDLRFPGHEHTPIINGIPQGWRVVSVADLGEYINGYSFKPTDWGKQGLPIIKIKEMSSGIGDDTPRNSGDNVPSKLFINSGDILFSWSATLSVMVWSQGKGLLNQHIFKVVPKAGIADMFVVQAIASKLPEFSNLTTGATMKHIQRGKLKEVFVMLPPASVMAAFESLSKPMLQQSMLCSLRINRATEARDRLLPKLMSGEVEV